MLKTILDVSCTSIFFLIERIPLWKCTLTNFEQFQQNGGAKRHWLAWPRAKMSKGGKRSCDQGERCNVVNLLTLPLYLSTFQTTLATLLSKNQQVTSLATFFCADRDIYDYNILHHNNPTVSRASSECWGEPLLSCSMPSPVVRTNETFPICVHTANK